MEQKIVDCARSWLGTKFRYHGRLKKSETGAGGVDCLGLIVGVGGEIGAVCRGQPIGNFDRLDYPKIMDKKSFEAHMDRVFPVIFSGGEKIGDIILFEYGVNLYHLGILTDMGVIHCHSTLRKVVEHRLDEFWLSKIRKFYRWEFANRREYPTVL